MAKEEEIRNYCLVDGSNSLQMSLKFIITLAISFLFPFIGSTPPERRTSDLRTLKPLPINIDSYATMKQGGYIYVDKTAIIQKLIKSGRKFNFLSRPEGFGKTLLLSTMDEIFRGNKNLFEGTKIYENDYEWTTYPVVKIDFSKFNCDSASQLTYSLMRSLRQVAKSYGISVQQSTTDVAGRVKSLIEGLREKFSQKVVFLIDEHEHAYLENFNPQQKADEVHAVLRNFYSSLQNETEEIEFCFTAHVNFISRITSKQHLYSHGDDDITTIPDYAQITGFTHEEVEMYFNDHVEAVAKHKNVTMEEVYEEMISWYYGYWFREDLPQKPTTSRPSNGTQFYNPHSILKYLQSKEPGIYWSELQSPTVNSLLKEFIEQEPWNALIYLQDRNENTHWTWSFVDLKMYGRKSGAVYLGDNGNRALNKFMLERGYFVKTHRGEPPMTTSTEVMDFANREVEELFRNHVTKVLGVQPQRLIEIARVMREKLLKVQIDEFIVNMNTFLSMLPPFAFSTPRKMPKDNSTDPAKIEKAMFRWNFHGALIVTRLFNGYDYFKVSEDDPLRGYADHCPNYVFYLRTSEEKAVEECSWGDVPSRSNDTTSAVCLDIAFNATSRQIIEWDTTIRKIELKKLGKKYLNADA